MSLQDEIYKRIKEEIDLDPMKIGYAGKTDEEIQALLNNPVVRTVTQTVTEQSPMNRILSGLAFAPNVVADKAEVTSAKAFVAKDVIAE